MTGTRARLRLGTDAPRPAMGPAMRPVAAVLLLGPEFRAVTTEVRDRAAACELSPVLTDASLFAVSVQGRAA